MPLYRPKSIDRIQQRKWNELQDQLDSKLSRVIQWEFASFFQKQLALSPAKKQAILGNYCWKGIIKIYLHHYLYYETTRDIEQQYGISCSTLQWMLDWCHEKVCI